MQPQPKPKRPPGTGTLLVHRQSNGTETWYGQWREHGKRVKRRIGPKRQPGSSTGMTRVQAEHALRDVIRLGLDTPEVVARQTVQEAGERLVRHLETLGRKPATISAYKSLLEIHLAPHFTGPLVEITPEQIEAFMAAKRRDGKSPKTILNTVGLLHSIFDFALKKKWATSNPCKLVDKPQPAGTDPDIRYLDLTEVEALLRAVPADDIGRVDRVMYLTAAMTGMRQGELIALRWQDIDWTAARVRVRRNYVHGEFGTPKSKRSSRAVPLAPRLAVELELLFQAAAFQADDDLVFGHPHLGTPMERSRLLKRYKAALKRAGVREVRFHDLRHTFGTRMAAAGVPMRTLQEWLGHRDFKTTLIYADYAPGAHEADMVARAFETPQIGAMAPPVAPNREN